jgi:ankyrin repeat protein
MLAGDPSLLNRGDRSGGSPLHRAVIGSARAVIELLLDYGANIDAIHSTSRGGGAGWWATDVQAIDLAIWGWNLCAPSKRDVSTARLLLARGAACDLTIASALGDITRVTEILDANPDAIRGIRPNGRRPLTAAVEFGHGAIALLLLDRGADPTWPECGAERGAALRMSVFTTIVTKGKRDLLQRLLDAGVRVPAVLTGCQSYLLEHTDMLRALLAHGMSADLTNWQRQTLLHLVCRGPDATGRAIEPS